MDLTDAYEPRAARLMTQRFGPRSLATSGSKGERISSGRAVDYTAVPISLVRGGDRDVIATDASYGLDIPLARPPQRLVSPYVFCRR
jgi:hypothetical protein